MSRTLSSLPDGGTGWLAQAEVQLRRYLFHAQLKCAEEVGHLVAAVREALPQRAREKLALRLEACEQALATVGAKA